jgi:hypothetical protein
LENKNKGFILPVTLWKGTYLLIDENGVETAIFTGDTLFLGDVGRPDLAQKHQPHSGRSCRNFMTVFRTKSCRWMTALRFILLMVLVCLWKKYAERNSRYFGNQKRTNYALNQPDKESFIKEVLDGLTAPPKYFGMNVAMNKGGYESLDVVMNKGSTRCS